MSADALVRIYVGLDRSQMLACQVLERSIRKRTDRTVELTPMIDLALPQPANPQFRARTGFSFARFAIPELAGRKGRAIYLDADMLVLQDIAGLWNVPFGEAKIVCQEDLPPDMATSAPEPGKLRRKQCSVMLLDCSALDWDAASIIAGLGVHYTYEQLLYELCILDEREVSYILPVRWNSLERLDQDTCLIHYTDMPTQPWVFAANPNGWIWVDELRDMVAEGAMSRTNLDREIDAGFARPSLLRQLDMPAGPLKPEAMAELADIDAAAGFKPHDQLARRLEQRRSPWFARVARRIGRELVLRR